jgi:acyl-CoA thioester hydrolase
MGDTLRVVNTLTNKPMAKLLFDQKVYNQRDELVCCGNVVVGFISADRRMPIRAPKIFLEKIDAYFPED